MYSEETGISKPLVRNDRRHQPGLSLLYKVSSCTYPVSQRAITSSSTSRDVRFKPHKDTQNPEQVCPCGGLVQKLVALSTHSLHYPA